MLAKRGQWAVLYQRTREGGGVAGVCRRFDPGDCVAMVGGTIREKRGKERRDGFGKKTKGTSGGGRRKKKQHNAHAISFSERGCRFDPRSTSKS